MPNSSVKVSVLKRGKSTKSSVTMAPVPQVVTKSRSLDEIVRHVNELCASRSASLETNLRELDLDKGNENKSENETFGQDLNKGNEGEILEQGPELDYDSLDKAKEETTESGQIIDELQSSSGYESILDKKVRDYILELEDRNAKLEEYCDELVGEQEEVKKKLEMMSEAYNQIQSRFDRILKDQVEFIEIAKRINSSSKRQQEYFEEKRAKKVDKPEKSWLEEIKDIDELAKVIDNQNLDKDCENENEDKEVIKLTDGYLKKLTKTEPIYLSKLLNMHFEPERAFALSNSILDGIDLHMDDSKLAKLNRPLPFTILLLLREVSKLRRSLNDVSRAYLTRMSKVDDLLIKNFGSDHGVVDVIVENDSIQRSTVVANESNRLRGGWDRFLPPSGILKLSMMEFLSKIL